MTHALDVVNRVQDDSVLSGFFTYHAKEIVFCRKNSTKGCMEEILTRTQLLDPF